MSSETNGKTPKIRIDSHVHVFPPRRLAGLMRWILKAYPAHPVPAGIDADGILSDLRAMGVSHFFNFAYPLKHEETASLNDFNIDFCSSVPEAIPFGSMHQDDANKPDIAADLLDRGCIGLKFHPFVQKFDPWDERMGPLYDYLEEVRRPVFLHTGFEAFYQKPMPAKKLAALLEKHPRLPAVFVHMMFPEIELAFKLLDDFPELLLDTTNCFATFKPIFKPVLEAWGGANKLRDIFYDGIWRHKGRVLFGSDHPAGMGSLEQIYADMEDFGFPDDVMQALVADAPMNFIRSFVPDYPF